MPKFKVWFEHSILPGYYCLTVRSTSRDKLTERWEEIPFFVGISQVDESDLPPAIQEWKKTDAYNLQMSALRDTPSP